MNRLRITGYEVVVAPAALDRLPELIAEVAPAHRYAIITDENVGSLYGERVRGSLPSGTALLTVPPGEGSKTRERWAELTDRMLESGFGRDSAIVALGGGMIGDLAGFVAATYMRGVPVIQLPTTLLAMVDASAGAKTGVNTPGGKNLVGAFLRPAVVVIDPDVLRTLPRRQLAGGFSEVLKHGVIADAEYFQRIADEGAELLDPNSSHYSGIIQHSIRIKGGIVERDELERGERMVLNFGHTLAHAIEAATGYSLLHGEAVGIGMVLESRCGEEIGVTERGTAARIAQALRSLGLPTGLTGEALAETILNATRTDKKRRSGELRLALPARIGAMSGIEQGWSTAVPEALVEAVLRDPSV
jgi:3-dehydroquinate synthase